ncbi:hypothetical protein V1478_011048 [Vespula squamosa]|uniref:Uncharacterized protein n=1 Tax=Vespula squamosa TaxID=30214 RepID=A0ABD2AGS1_VESSQ
MSPGNILRDPISSWCSSLRKSGQSPQSCIKDLIVRKNGSDSDLSSVREIEERNDFTSSRVHESDVSRTLIRVVLPLTIISLSQVYVTHDKGKRASENARSTYEELYSVESEIEVDT